MTAPRGSGTDLGGRGQGPPLEGGQHSQAGGGHPHGPDLLQSVSHGTCCEQRGGAESGWGPPGEVGGGPGEGGVPEGRRRRLLRAPPAIVRAGAGAACLSPRSPLMQLRPPWAQDMRMGDGDADPRALRQGAPWEGVSHGRLPAEKTLSVVSVNVFRFLILWVKNYILRLGRSRPERQAPRQSGALVAPMQGRPQLQLQGFVMQPPGLGHRQGSGQPGRRGTVGAEPVPWAWSRPRRGGPHAASLSPPCWVLPPNIPHPTSLAPSAGGVSLPPHSPPHRVWTRKWLDGE